MKELNMRVPRAVRPLQTEYQVIGEILHELEENLYNTTEKDFCYLAMLKSHGGMNPDRVKKIYRELMKEAGLKPLEDNDA